MNAALSLWHVHEWYFWEHKPTANRNDLTKYAGQDLPKHCPALGWLRDVADATKHMGLNRTKPPVVVQKMESQNYLPPFSLAGIVTEYTITVNGKRHSLHAAMHKAFLYWLDTILPHHVSYRIVDSADRLLVGEAMMDWCRQKLGKETERRKQWAYFPSDDHSGHYAFLSKAAADDFCSTWIDGNDVLPA
jgi:hypothetical protein